jgi:hypothetical protein
MDDVQMDNALADGECCQSQTMHPMQGISYFHFQRAAACMID